MDKLIRELNPDHEPIIESDFYKWLNLNHSPDWTRISDKRKYLKERGFQVGTHVLSKETISTLNAIYSYHFDINRIKTNGT